MPIGEPKMSSESIEDKKNRSDIEQLTDLENMSPAMTTKIDGHNVDFYIPEEGTIEMFVDGECVEKDNYSFGSATVDEENVNDVYDALLTKRFGEEYRDRCE